MRFFLGAGILVLFFAGCGKPAPEPLVPPGADIRWGFAPSAIVLQMTAASDLNVTDGAPSSLALCVYQLASRLPAATHMVSEQGIDLLQECRSFDPSVVVFQRVFADPGKGAELFFDREEGVHYLLVVAGYHEGTPPGMAVMEEIPVPAQEEPGWFCGLFQSKKPEWREPSQLVMGLRLGPSGMVRRPAEQEFGQEMGQE